MTALVPPAVSPHPSVDPDALDLPALVARFGSPLYVYDLDVVSARVAELRGALPRRVEVAYAVKANPSLAVLAHLASLGLGADVASAGELDAVLRAGMAAGGIVMTGPGKRDQELRAAVAAGVRAITVESSGELERLEALAREVPLSAPIPVTLRANRVGETPREPVPLIRAEVPKFGMDRAELFAAAAHTARSSVLRLVGVHAFGASNVLDAAALVEHAAAVAALASAVARATGVPLRIVDAGGGLGIPYADGDPPLDLRALGAGLAGVVDGWASDPGLRDATLLLEPGRFVLGPAGAYAARVVSTKRIGGELVAVLDGGIHHLLRPALVGQAHRVHLVTDREPRGETRVTVVGPLCTGLDVLARDVVMPEPRPGDVLCVLDAGAYGFTESMPLFLSHPAPAEVGVRGGRAELLRPRIEPGAWLDQQRLPTWS